MTFLKPSRGPENLQGTQRKPTNMELLRKRAVDGKKLVILRLSETRLSNLQCLSLLLFLGFGPINCLSVSSPTAGRHCEKELSK